MPSMSSKKDPVAAKNAPPPAPATDAAASKKKDTIAGAEGVEAQEAKLAPPEAAKAGTRKAAKG